MAVYELFSFFLEAFVGLRSFGGVAPLWLPQGASRAESDWSPEFASPVRGFRLTGDILGKWPLNNSWCSTRSGRIQTHTPVR